MRINLSGYTTILLQHSREATTLSHPLPGSVYPGYYTLTACRHQIIQLCTHCQMCCTLRPQYASNKVVSESMEPEQAAFDSFLTLGNRQSGKVCRGLEVKQDFTSLRSSFFSFFTQLPPSLFVCKTKCNTLNAFGVTFRKCVPVSQFVPLTGSGPHSQVSVAIWEQTNIFFFFRSGVNSPSNTHICFDGLATCDRADSKIDSDAA